MPKLKLEKLLAVFLYLIDTKRVMTPLIAPIIPFFELLGKAASPGLEPGTC
jgi:hypothetical protein